MIPGAYSMHTVCSILVNRLTIIFNRLKNERRKEEARIRIQAQKAARKEESRRYEERKKKDAKRKLEEERLLEKEIQKMRKELENQRIQIEKHKSISKKEIIKKVHHDQQRQREIHNEKMRKMQMKFQLEAKNKLIIEKRIQGHVSARSACIKSAFQKWKQVLIHRRKQAGTAAALYDWRTMKTVFNRWKRFTRSEKEKRIVHLEKNKAFRVEAYRSRILGATKEKMISKYFHSWRVFAKRAGEVERLEKSEQETKDKMNKLLEKLKNKNKLKNNQTQSTDLEVMYIEEDQVKTPIIAWDGPKITKEATVIKVVDTFKNRNQAQEVVINKQKMKLKEQEEKIEELLKSKLDLARQVKIITL